MSTAFREGKFWFFCHAREQPYEPPHVHVIYDKDGWEARISLTSGAWMDEPGRDAAVAMRLFQERREDCIACWNTDHPRRRI